MRSLEEIDAEIRQLQEAKAGLSDGIPTRMIPEYRASRFDYILKGDRSGLDAYQQALQNAMLQKAQREENARLQEAQRKFTAAENEANRQVQRETAKNSSSDDELKWHRDLALANSTLRQVRQAFNAGTATQKDVDDAMAEYNYLVDHGISKGYKGVPSAASAENTSLESNPAVKMQQALKEMAGKETPTKEELDKAETIAAFLEEQGADMSQVKATIANKRESLAKKDWESAADSAKALINKPKVTIAELKAKKEELQSYSDMKGFDALINDIDKKINALTPKKPLPFKRG